jgi:hypothetical protein
MLLDVNVVLALHRGDHPEHDVVRAWFDQIVGQADRFTVPSTVWASVVRLATHRRVFEAPSPVVEVFRFARAVVELPNHVHLASGPQHLERFEDLCRAGDATGDLVPDAQLAALAVDQGASIVTFDRDFLRFEDLDVVRPGA